MRSRPLDSAAWLVPDWPAPPGVHALCTSRAGGVSSGPWASLNLGDHVGDDPAHVAANRERLGTAIEGITPGARTVFLQQIHGVGIVELGAASAHGQVADACVSKTPGMACTIMVADCLPVLFAHDSGLVVAAAHAGWRGLAGIPPGRSEQLPGPGVLEETFRHFCALVCQAQATELPVEVVAARTLVWLGPCIGPDSFEVGTEVRAALAANHAEALEHFRALSAGRGKYLANLPALARQRLQALGITAIYGNDGGAQWCTVANPSRFFSHRRDAARLGSSGRFAACIWVDGRPLGSAAA